MAIGPAIDKSKNTISKGNTDMNEFDCEITDPVFNEDQMFRFVQKDMYLLRVYNDLQ